SYKLYKEMKQRTQQEESDNAYIASNNTKVEEGSYMDEISFYNPQETLESMV
ncbi:21110_t:CDS:1, partial [Dentiscutata erythropus]